LIACIVVLLASCGQNTEVFSESSRAIKGYDPVAYFREGKPVKGDEALTYYWKEANWYFSTRENLDSFSRDPMKYAPQYGGYCAYGCSEGHKAPTDPAAWTIVDGKLYLNYNLEVKQKWLRNQEERIEQANKNWPVLKDEK